MKDYNKQVYVTMDYKKLRNANNNFDDFRVLINYCHEYHHEIYFFSNAPYRWILNTLKDEPDIISSVNDVRKVLDINEDDEHYLKPYQPVYDKLNSYFNKDNIVFIDDNIGNMKPTMNNIAWTNILFCNTNKKINNRLYFVDDLANTINII